MEKSSPKTSLSSRQLWELYYECVDYKHVLELMHERGLLYCDNEMLRDMDKYDRDLMRDYIKWHNPIFKPRMIGRTVRRKNGPIRMTKWGPIDIGLNTVVYKYEQVWDRDIILPRKKLYLKFYIEAIEEYFATYKRIWDDLTFEGKNDVEKLIFHAWRLHRYYQPLMDWVSYEGPHNTDAVQEYREETGDKPYFLPILRDYQDLERKLKRAKGEYEYDGAKTGELTPEMIQRAKEYPFSGLAKFNRAGFAPCPYHKEKTPSFSLNKKHNYAHCFGCSKSVDTIQYVMDTMNLEFREAVMFLNGK